MLPNFHPTLRTICLRLLELMIAELKLLANQRDVPYQSLLRVFLAERIGEELTPQSGARILTTRKRTGSLARDAWARGYLIAKLENRRRDTSRDASVPLRFAVYELPAAIFFCATTRIE
jgi:hypothetical protein